MPPPSSSDPTAILPSARTRPKPTRDVLAETERQWLYTEEELLQTPSILDGMSPKDEREVRTKGINFIGQVGIMLKLPQTTLTAAGTYFNRFLMRESLVTKKEGPKALHQYQVAAVCIFLATKVEEQCRKMKEIVIALCRVAQKNPNLIVDENTKDYWRWRDTILYNEDVLLEKLCFDLTVQSPHERMFKMLTYYGIQHNKPVRNAAWGFINDSNMTQLCVLFDARTIAAAAIYIGARLHEVKLPDEHGKPWWEIQHVSLKDIRRAVNYMAGLYEGVQPKEGIENIYVRLPTPVDGSPQHAKTRLIVEQTPETASMERSTSNQSLKRPREEEESARGNGNGMEIDQQETKRIKAENGASRSREEATLPVNDSSKDEEDVSEEGEVEE